MARVRETRAMIAGMDPALRPGRWVFVSGPPKPVGPALLDAAIASFREPEGLSLILPEALADAHGLPHEAALALITLTVNSSVEGVGLTAAAATVLADAGIACNVVAAAMHDHLFVPFDRAEDALASLTRLQRDAGA